jgi:hypothetical protein
MEVADQQSLSSIWYYSQIDDFNFAERCEAFYWMFERILESGHLRLKKNDEYLTGTPKELVQRFHDVLPKTDVPYVSHPHLDLSDWFFDPQCPGEAVWRVDHPDGQIEWRHCP